MARQEPPQPDVKKPRKPPSRHGYTIRQMKSGRWQVLVRAADGRQVSEGTWPENAKRAAEKHGLDAAHRVPEHMWVDPRKSDIPLAQFMRSWLKRKAASGEHGEKYRVEAARMAESYIAPTLGTVLLTDLHPGHIAEWLAEFKADRIAEYGRVGLVPAKTYRLLHACLHDAFEQRYLASNPCIIRGAANERSPERPLVTSEQVALLAATIEPRWSAAVLTAGWGSLRFGELQRLTRGDVDLLHNTLRVRKAKTAAGVRTVHLPAPLVGVLERHLATFVRPDPEAWVFPGERGGQLNKAFFSKEFRRARGELGLDAVTVHDLRHHGGTMTAVSGATLREIMDHMGHASPRAALIYQHVAVDRQEAVAVAKGALWVDAPAGGKVRKLRG